MGDSDEVLALLLYQARRHPDLVELMKTQGVWSADFEDWRKPVSRPVTEGEKRDVFLRVTGGGVHVLNNAGQNGRRPV